MTDTDSQTYPRAVSRIARNPKYVSIFADAFYEAYVGREPDQSYSGVSRTRQTSAPMLFVSVLFKYTRAAIYLYRELHFTRFMSDDSFVPNWNSRLREVIVERSTRFFSTINDDFYLAERVNIAKQWVPAFLHSTDVVFKQIEHDLRQLDAIYPSTIDPRNRELLRPLLLRAISDSEAVRQAYTAQEIHDYEVVRAIERYKQAVGLLDRPPGVPEPQSFERLFVVGLELELLRRLYGLPDSNLLGASNEVITATQRWRRTHDSLLTQLLEHGVSKDDQLEFFHAEVHHAFYSAIRNQHHSFALSFSINAPFGHKDATFRDKRNNLVDRTKALLAKILPETGTISSGERLPIATPEKQESSLMVDRYPRGLIRAFSASVWVSAAGVAAAASGLATDKFWLLYSGTGLIAFGLSVVSLTLIFGERYREQHPQ